MHHWWRAHLCPGGCSSVLHGQCQPCSPCCQLPLHQTFTPELHCSCWRYSPNERIKNLVLESNSLHWIKMTILSWPYVNLSVMSNLEAKSNELGLKPCTWLIKSDMLVPYMPGGNEVNVHDVSCNTIAKLNIRQCWAVLLNMLFPYSHWLWWLGSNLFMVTFLQEILADTGIFQYMLNENILQLPLAVPE